MKQQTRFPDLSNNRFAGGFSDDPDRNTGVMLDGMRVIFDKKVSAAPVVMDYKQKRKVLGKTGEPV